MTETQETGETAILALRLQAGMVANARQEYLTLLEQIKGQIDEYNKWVRERFRKAFLESGMSWCVDCGRLQSLSGFRLLQLEQRRCCYTVLYLCASCAISRESDQGHLSLQTVDPRGITGSGPGSFMRLEMPYIPARQVLKLLEHFRLPSEFCLAGDEGVLVPMASPFQIPKPQGYQ